MTVYKIGTIVNIKGCMLDAIITGITISFNGVKYEVTYYINGDQKAYWIFENEFTCNKNKIYKIGFK